MQKSTKRFILINNQVNSIGFRVIVPGIDLSDFIKNPVLYWMDKIEVGYLTDFKQNESELSAVPVFDDKSALALKLLAKVEHNIIRATEVSLTPCVTDANKANWVTGQTMPTYIRSQLEKVSLIDFTEGNAEVSGLSSSLKLSDKLLKNLNMDSKTNDNTERVSAGNFSPEIGDIVQNAIDAGKLTKDEADNMLSIATKDPSVEGAIKNVIKKKPIKPENIRGKYHHRLIDLAASKSYDDIKSKEPGGLNDLMYDAPALYKAKHFEKFGRLPVVVATRH
jgi:hypothetical protein